MSERIYHRIQGRELNELMQRTGKVGGRRMRNIGSGILPRVKAYDGPLPPECTGIEFTTEVEPYSGSIPGKPTWRQGDAGVEVAELNELVLIPVTIIRRQD
ncbi:MAG: hypothetical protein JO197_10200 [Acidobacteria bacterium]|nr:hypothetical protein [Acidobacteriota bacterium]MBV9477465.1 hypothetical protein [Acidobacteriota bacterium]